MHRKIGKNVVLIGLSGPSSSGKSTSAKVIHSLLKNSILVHLDDFYLPDNKIPIDAETREQNWDCPQAINFAKFTEYIKGLKSGEQQREIESFEIEPSMNLGHNEIDSLKQRLHKYDVDDTLLILVDGFMLYHDVELVQLLDVKLFYHASYETLKERREARAGYQTIEGFWVDPPGYFNSIVWPEFEKGHKYLFKNDDVNSELNDYAKNELQICDYKNEKSSSLLDLVSWSLETILEKVYN